MMPLLRNIVSKKGRRVNLMMLALLVWSGLNNQEYSSIVRSAINPPNMTSCASAIDIIIMKGVNMKNKRLP